MASRLLLFLFILPDQHCGDMYARTIAILRVAGAVDGLRIATAELQRLD